MNERDEGAPGARPSWQTLRAALAERGFRPSRRLGQNFLVDVNAARAIARDAAVGPGDTVLEVGVGLGFLTTPLLEQGIDALVAVEIDARLLELAKRFVGADPRVQWILADVLEGKHALAREVGAALPVGRPWHLASNLPYSVSGPLLAVLAARAEPPASMTVLVQREVAERLLARPATPEWGPLAVAVQSLYAGRIVRELGPTLFRPRPKVWSSLVRLEPRPGGPGRAERELVGRLARLVFLHRRQSLGRVLGGLMGPERAAKVLSEAGVASAARAETLDLETLGRLARAAGPLAH